MHSTTSRDLTTGGRWDAHSLGSVSNTERDGVADISPQAFFQETEAVAAE
jgi:hypothetical protein